MSEENSIGLAELIQQVKQELLMNDLQSGEAPFLSVDEVTLELQVTIQKEGNAGIKIHVIQIGGKLSRGDVQTITVTLTPLLSKEERLEQFKKQYPGGVGAAEAAIAKTSVKATVKGSSKESQRKTFEG